MMMRLFDFSLLTKMSPVSLAAAGREIPATTGVRTAMLTERRSRITGISLCLHTIAVADSVRPIKAAEQAARRMPGGHRAKGRMQVDERAVTPALLLDKVVKTYGPVRAVDGVSLVAQAGEFIALLGPNGTGKSTLFQLLSGLFLPDSGRIEVMGHDMSRDAVPALAELGIVFQQPTLDLELSVTANLLFHAGLHGMPRSVAKARIDEELIRLGLKDRAHDKTATLSGGNRRRVELARALLHKPRVLLMDEPTVGLDPASRADLLKLLLTMRTERRVAILWATHLCDEVPDADRVIVLHRGKVLADTTPTQLVTSAGAATIEDAFLAMTGDGSRRD